MVSPSVLPFVLGSMNCVWYPTDDKMIVGCDMQNEIQNHVAFVMMVEAYEAPRASYLAADKHTLRKECNYGQHGE